MSRFANARPYLCRNSDRVPGGILWVLVQEIRIHAHLFKKGKTKANRPLYRPIQFASEAAGRQSLDSLERQCRSQVYPRLCSARVGAAFLKSDNLSLKAVRASDHIKAGRPYAAIENGPVGAWTI